MNFERGNLLYQNGELKDSPETGDGFTPELSKDNGYYREIKYFMECIINNTEIIRVAPEDTMETIQIAEAEKRSADNHGLKTLIIT